MKKLFLSIIILCVSVSLFAGELKIVGDFYIQDGILKLYTGKESVVEIPNGVEEIDFGVFQNNYLIEKLICPESLKIIDTKAFKHCKNLKSVEFSQSLKTINRAAFEDCSALVEAKLPKSLEFIGDNAFLGCINLRSVYLGANISKMGECIFKNLPELEEVIIENGITDLGKRTFEFDLDEQKPCLKEIEIPGSVKVIEENLCYGQSSLEKIILNDGIRTIKANAFYSNPEMPKSKLLTLAIPDSVEIIQKNAFSNCTGLEDLTFGKNISIIEVGAFACETQKPNDSLKSLVFFDNLKTIGDVAFYNFVGLENISFEDGIEKIGNYAFAQNDENVNTGLKKLIFPDTLSEIGENAFYNYSGLEELNLGDGISKLGEYAFAMNKDKPNSNLKELRISGLLGVVEKYAFAYHCGLEKLTIDNSVNTIMTGAFMCDGANPNNSLKELNIPNSILYIGASAFNNFSALEKLTFEDGIKTICNNAFDCSEACNNGLKELTLPKTLEEVMDNAFCNYKYLETVNIYTKTKQGKDVFKKLKKESKEKEIKAKINKYK